MACTFFHQCTKCGFSVGFGPYPSPKPDKARTGFDSDCLCLTCWRQGNDRKVQRWNYYYNWLGLLRRGFRIERDKKKCPYCGSTNVMAVKELSGKPFPTCPKCKRDILRELICHLEDREEKLVKLPHRHKFRL